MAEAKKTGEASEDFLTLLRERFNRARQWVIDNNDEAMDDLRFAAGEQWDDDLKALREKQKRPCLTENHIRQYVRQVTGDIRLNKPAIRVRPVDDKADPETAKLYTGLIRNIEQQSGGSAVYVKAGDDATTCGIGHFRIVTDYADDDAFDQDIRLEAIWNPLSVVWDPDSRKPTREDAKYCFVLRWYSKEEFKDNWPNASTADFEAGVENRAEYITHWMDGERILVAEYWCRKPENKTIARMADGKVHDVTLLTDAERTEMQRLSDEIQAQQGKPSVPMRLRDVESHRIERHIVNGSEILEGPEVWPGRYIPIIPVVGEEIHVGEEVKRRGIVRDMKDPQRMLNYHSSAAVEAVALAPKAPFTATQKQIEGYEDQWENANTENRAVLVYKGDSQANGPPQRTRQAETPIALLQLKQGAVDTLSNVTGIYPSSLGQQSNETSGKAIIARERQGDVGTFVYVDNLAIAIAYCGRQLVDLIPKIYDGERVVRVLGEDDSDELMQVNALAPDGAVINDLTAGKYDVIVSTGPSFSTKRQEAAESLLQFIQSAPETAELAMDLLVKNFDWPGSDELAERFRKIAIQKGIVEPDPEKGEEAPQQQPDPKALEAQAKVEKMAAETDGQKLQNVAQMIEIMLADAQVQAMIRQHVMGAVGDVMGGQAPPGAPAPPDDSGTAYFEQGAP